MHVCLEHVYALFMSERYLHHTFCSNAYLPGAYLKRPAWAFLAPSRHYAGLLRKVLLRHADVAPLSIIHFAMTSLQNE